MNKQIIEILMISIALSGCASIEKSTLLGAGTFGAIGTGVGAAAGKSVGGALLGLGIGALFGGTMGYLTHKDMEQKERMKQPLSKNDGADQTPWLPHPKFAESGCPRNKSRAGWKPAIGSGSLRSPLDSRGNERRKEQWTTIKNRN